MERGTEDNLEKDDTELVNFRDQKVFLISSARIFWGKGTAISFQGRKVLSDMASFLKEVPNRIVISEYRPGNEKSNEHIGLQRAWAVLEYLTRKEGLDKRQFCISAASTVGQKSLKNREPDYRGVEAERTLEIVLLERSIYN